MNSNISTQFFKDLKQYNATNFKTLQNADLTHENATVHKAFSSVVTRYFIFMERHPEISDQDKRILYFKLKIDMIARYFSNYPETDLEELRPFQKELQEFVKEMKKQGGTDAQYNSAPSLQNSQLAAAN